MLNLGERCFTGESSVYPDIIIHKRGRKEPDLLVIETKKDPDGQPRDAKRDLKKLRAYKRELKYDFAVFLKVCTGENHRCPQIQWVENGPN